MSTEPKLHRYKAIPPGFLDAGPTQLKPLLGNPTLLEVGISNEAPLFVSCLLHGNEVSGLTIIQNILKEYDHHAARPLLIFIGNVFAAEKGVRRLDSGSDYNRIWRGGSFPEKTLAEELLSILKRAKPFAALDLHNNTGRNPVYGCIREVDHAHVGLASLFSSTAVHTERPKETLSHVLTDLCPAMTCECGLPGSPEGIQKALDLIRDCLHLKGLPDRHVHRADLNVYCSIARIHLPSQTTVSFEIGENVDFRFEKDFDLQNFSPVSTGSVFGWRKGASRLTLIDEDGKDIADQYFSYEGEKILVQRSFVPAMLTTIPKMVYQDCLGYVMQPVEGK